MAQNPAAVKVAVKSVYKSLIKTSLLVECNEKRSKILKDVREGFRKDINESDPDRIDELIMKAHSKLSFLRMVTPKTTRDAIGITKIAYIDGKMLEGQGENRGKAALSNWDGSNMDPDSVSRHYHGLKRAGFVDNSHAKGIF
mmetsp:Transcript_5158/g.7848  ORF Transcript_5158/g.7848 Transcript_5158/m.7848 type:complete len:142 (-) Transcript_5158:130-555(-)